MQTQKRPHITHLGASDLLFLRNNPHRLPATPGGDIYGRCFLWLYNITIKKTCQATKYDRFLALIGVFHTFHTRASPCRHSSVAYNLGIFHYPHPTAANGKYNLLQIPCFSASHNRRRHFLCLINKGISRRQAAVNMIYRVRRLRLPVQPLCVSPLMCIMHNLRV